MGKMINQPCLSKEGIENGLREILGDKYDEKIEKLINDNFIGWFSRSMATSGFVFAKNKNFKWCVLGVKRGKGCPDFNGFWNACSGYLEPDLTLRENCVKEIYEESGIHISINDLTFVGFDDNPVTSNHQNVTARFAKIFFNDVSSWEKTFWLFCKYAHDDVFWAEDIKLSLKNMEEDEVEELKWIPLDEVQNYEWAFNHGKHIMEIAKKLLLI